MNLDLIQTYCNNVGSYIINPCNTIEILMAMSLVVASFLIARQNQNAFWFWLIANSLGTVFFFNSKNYGMFLLSVYGIITTIYGIWNWKFKSKKLT